MKRGRNNAKITANQLLEEAFASGNVPQNELLSNNILFAKSLVQTLGLDSQHQQLTVSAIVQELTGNRGHFKQRLRDHLKAVPSERNTDTSVSAQLL
jgi:hypothetical protein